MRTCLFQVWVNSKTPLYEGSKSFKKEMCEPRQGVFLAWGVTAGDEGSTDSVALVEDNEGRVHEVYPANIMFTDKQFPKVWGSRA